MSIIKATSIVNRINEDFNSLFTNGTPTTLLDMDTKEYLSLVGDFEQEIDPLDEVYNDSLEEISNAAKNSRWTKLKEGL